MIVFRNFRVGSRRFVPRLVAVGALLGAAVSQLPAEDRLDIRYERFGEKEAPDPAVASREWFLFFIKPSGKPWTEATKIRVTPGADAHITLKSNDPFDLLIGRTTTNFAGDKVTSLMHANRLHLHRMFHAGEMIYDLQMRALTTGNRPAAEPETFEATAAPLTVKTNGTNPSIDVFFGYGAAADEKRTTLKFEPPSTPVTEADVKWLTEQVQAAK
jgi:hypothetical protein